MAVNSDDEDYAVILHGEGSPLNEYYPTLPEIPKTACVLGAGKHSRFSPSPVLKLKPDLLPVIKPGKRNGPVKVQPPSTPKLKKTRAIRRKKSPSELMEADLDPANKFSVLPEIPNTKKGASLPLSTLGIGVAKSPSPVLNLPYDVRAYKQKPLPDIKTATDELLKYQSRDKLKSRNAARRQGILGLASCRSPNSDKATFTSRLASRRGPRGGVCEQGVGPTASARSSENEVVINYEDYRTESRLDALVRSDIDMFMQDVYTSPPKKSPQPPPKSSRGRGLKPSQKLDMMLDIACIQGAVDSGYAGVSGYGGYGGEKRSGSDFGEVEEYAGVGENSNRYGGVGGSGSSFGGAGGNDNGCGDGCGEGNGDASRGRLLNRRQQMRKNSFSTKINLEVGAEKRSSSTRLGNGGESSTRLPRI